MEIYGTKTLYQALATQTKGSIQCWCWSFSWDLLPVTQRFKKVCFCAAEKKKRWNTKTKTSVIWIFLLYVLSVNSHPRSVDCNKKLFLLWFDSRVTASVMFFAVVFSTLTEPRWASVNRGVLICDECCSVHRSLGRHSSQVRHLTHTPWPPAQLQVNNSTRGKVCASCSKLHFFLYIFVSLMSPT